MDGEERAGAGAAKNGTGRGRGARRPPSLTARQRVFINEYLIDVNATQAAIRAGYSRKTANEQAARLLANSRVHTEIQAAMDARAARTGIDADRVLRELARLAFSNITDFVEWGPAGLALKPNAMLMREKTPAIAHIDATDHRVTVRLHNKVGALNALARHLGIFNGPDIVTRQEVDEFLNALLKVLKSYLLPHQIESVLEDLKRLSPGLQALKFPARPDSSGLAPVPMGMEEESSAVLTPPQGQARSLDAQTPQPQRHEGGDLTCGACSAFDAVTRLCRLQKFYVSATLPACRLVDPLP